MKRHLRVIATLIRFKLSHLMVFRLTFFASLFIDGTMFLMQLLMFQAIYSQVDSIGGWSRGETVIFIGTFSLVNALNMVIYFFGVNDLPQKIITGTLDHYLTKPVSPLLRLTFESVDVGSVPLVLGSIAVISYGVSLAGITVTAGQVFAYIVLVLLMTLLWYDVEIILRTIPFFVLSTGITRLEEFIELCVKVPGVLFHGIFKVLFYFVLPYGIIATVPTQFLAGTLTAGGLCSAVLITAVFTALALGLWRLGVKHYKSASS